MAQFQARVFARKAGFTVVLDGESHFDVASLSDARRMARALVRARVAAAFPDRPELNREGAQNVLRFAVEVREVRRKSVVSSVRGPGGSRRTP